RLRHLLREHGGHLEQLSDGSFVAEIRGRGPAADSAARAARVALRLRERLPAMALVLATGKSRPDGRMPTGQVIDRAVALLRGEVQRIAAAPAGSAERNPVIRVDELTAGLLDTRFVLGGDDLGLHLRGRCQPLQIDRTLLGAPTPFVGRARELGHLIATFEECIEEPVARAVLITAPAGLGKSRLCSEFVQRLPDPDQVLLVLARGEMVGAGAAHALLGQGLRRLIGIHDGEPVAIRRNKLHAHVSACFPAGSGRQRDDLVRIATFLGELIGTPYLDRPDARLQAARHDARVSAEQQLRAWIDWLAAQCAQRPVLIVLDDLHWGDRATVSAVDAALRRLKDRPLMVLALARPEVAQRHPELWSR
ncbi:MAG: AAA family ATPase, partial [Myxococcota bacterium]